MCSRTTPPARRSDMHTADAAPSAPEPSVAATCAAPRTDARRPRPQTPPTPARRPSAKSIPDQTSSVTEGVRSAATDDADSPSTAALTDGDAVSSSGALLSLQTAEHLEVLSHPPAVCEVCCESVPHVDMRGCSGCEHRYCKSCLATYWELGIFSGSHSRLMCMGGGCDAMATDEDIRAAVSPRTFARMRYFRSRDKYVNQPHVRWCPRDKCWEPILHGPVANEKHVICGKCGALVCYKCGVELAPSDARSVRGVSPLPSSDAGSMTLHGPLYHAQPGDSVRQKSQSGVLVASEEGPVRVIHTSPSVILETTTEHVCTMPPVHTVDSNTCASVLWATFHTKVCPTCKIRIQRNKGCSHMTCSRCDAYFCWRCKGYLQNGASLPGRACVCDKILGVAQYTGLVVGAVILSPVIVVGAVVGSGPYVIYRVNRYYRSRARSRSSARRTSDRSSNTIVYPLESVSDSASRSEMGSTRSALSSFDISLNDERPSFQISSARARRLRATSFR